MKKITMLSVVAAAILFVGCGNKTKESTTDATAKAVESTKEAAATAGNAAKEAADKAADAAKEAGSAISEATNKAAEAAKEAVSKTADAAKETADKVVEATTEATTAAADAATNVAGAEAYSKCAGCHGADGKTKALGKSPEIAGQSKEDLVTKIKGYKAGTLNTAGMGTLMKGQVASMSDADIDAVAGYISTLK
jgi:cytochrome c553